MPEKSLIIACGFCNALNRIAASRLSHNGMCGKCKKRLFQGQPIDLNSRNFTLHLSKTDIPLIIKFWAPWCGPCKMMAPVYASACAQLEPLVRFARVNTDIEPMISTGFNIRSTPTCILFKNGNELGRQSGLLDAQALISWIKSTTQVS